MSDKKMMERKHFFINRKLQGRYMLTFLIPMLVMLLCMVATLYFAANSLVDIAANIVAQDLQSKTEAHLQDRSTMTPELYRTVLREIADYGAAFIRNVHYRKAVIQTLLLIFGCGVFLVIIQIVFLTIFFSHKLAGPIYRFEIACHSLIQGRYTEKIVLRKGDDMQNLAHLFNESVEKTRGRLQALRASTTLDEVKKILDSVEI